MPSKPDPIFKKPLQDRVLGDGEVFERIEGETDKSWQAFLLYRDYLIRHPDESARNIRFAMREGVPEEKIADPKQDEFYYDRWRRWSAKNKWAERVAHYDSYLDRQERKRRNKALKGVSNKLLTKINTAVDSVKVEDLKPSDLHSLTNAYGNLLRIAGDVEPEQIEILTPADEQEIAATAASLVRDFHSIKGGKLTDADAS